ncbi:hypothetical protein MG293_003058 [Ovis ammon polii]|uniref:Uncharacterized protein n=1 Tax=Ovis ammon polii TaxID=230172 RepID=A0AAD4UHT0_OVIAM|nr:hypothetical protein MG293_003058 [Ovis ammon polii]
MDSANSKDLRKQSICVKRGVRVARLNECPTDCAGQAFVLFMATMFINISRTEESQTSQYTEASPTKHGFLFQPANLNPKQRISRSELSGYVIILAEARAHQSLKTHSDPTSSLQPSLLPTSAAPEPSVIVLYWPFITLGPTGFAAVSTVPVTNCQSSRSHEPRGDCLSPRKVNPN